MRELISFRASEPYLASLNFLISRSREVVLGSNRDLVCDNPSFTRDQDKRTPTTYLPKQEDVEQKIIRCFDHVVFALTFTDELWSQFNYIDFSSDRKRVKSTTMHQSNLTAKKLHPFRFKFLHLLVQFLVRFK